MAQVQELKFYEVKETSRTYYFPSEDGARAFTIHDVRRIATRPTNHRLETLDGKKYIIPATYIAIEIEADVWTL